MIYPSVIQLHSLQAGCLPGLRHSGKFRSPYQYVSHLPSKESFLNEEEFMKALNDKVSYCTKLLTKFRSAISNRYCTNTLHFQISQITFTSSSFTVWTETRTFCLQTLNQDKGPFKWETNERNLRRATEKRFFSQS